MKKQITEIEALRKENEALRKENEELKKAVLELSKRLGQQSQPWPFPSVPQMPPWNGNIPGPKWEPPQPGNTPPYYYYNNLCESLNKFLCQS